MSAVTTGSTECNELRRRTFAVVAPMSNRDGRVLRLSHKVSTPAPSSTSEPPAFADICTAAAIGELGEEAWPDASGGAWYE
eukprot:82369-Rhodomonas_salina.1